MIRNISGTTPGFTNGIQIWNPYFKENHCIGPMAYFVYFRSVFHALSKWATDSKFRVKNVLLPENGILMRVRDFDHCITCNETQ